MIWTNRYGTRLHVPDSGDGMTVAWMPGPEIDARRATNRRTVRRMRRSHHRKMGT